MHGPGDLHETLHRLDEFAGHARFRVRVLDVRRRDEVMRLVATEQPWGLVHLAARQFIPDCERAPAETLEVNVLGTQHVLDACAHHPPRPLVFASTADVYEPSNHPHDETAQTGPQGVYGWSKLVGEGLLADQAHRLDGCQVVLARIFNVFGPGDPHPHLLPEVLRQARHHRQLRLGDLESARDFVYVDDVADALTVLLRTQTEGAYNLGSGVPVTGWDCGAGGVYARGA